MMTQEDRHTLQRLQSQAEQEKYQTSQEKENRDKDQKNAAILSEVIQKISTADIYGRAPIAKAVFAYFCQ